MSVLETPVLAPLEEVLAEHSFTIGDVIMMACVVDKIDDFDVERQTEIKSTELYRIMAPYIGTAALHVGSDRPASLRLVG